MHLCLARGVEGELKKGTMEPVIPSVPRDSYSNTCPSYHYPKVSQFSLFPYVPGEDALVLDKWVCASVLWPFKSMVSRPSAVICLSQMQSPMVFTVRCYGDYSSQHCCPRLGSPLWGWKASLFRGYLRRWNMSPNFSSPSLGYETCLFCVSVPPPCGFLLSLVIENFCSANLHLVFNDGRAIV